MTSKVPMKIVGHRGARGLAPENTVASIRKGIKHHVDEIEIDVRVTKDGIVILHHDLDLKDQTGNSYNVRHATYKELLAHKPDLTTLDEAIVSINKAVPLQIEVKSGEKVQPVVKIVQKYLDKGWKATDFLFGSKSRKTLLELRRALPNVPVVVIESWSGVVAHWRLLHLGGGAVRLSMGKRWLWDGYVSMVSRTRCQLYVYTLDDPVLAKRWAKLGMTGVITDRPDLYDK